MTKDDIIKLAVEAGLIRAGDGWTEPHRWGLAEIETFANLVAAAERNRTWTQKHWTEYERSIAAEAYRCGYEAGVVEEREECAKVCERDDSIRCLAAAQAIRARGKA